MSDDKIQIDKITITFSQEEVSTVEAERQNVKDALEQLLVGYNRLARINMAYDIWNATALKAFEELRWELLKGFADTLDGMLANLEVQ